MNKIERGVTSGFMVWKVVPAATGHHLPDPGIYTPLNFVHVQDSLRDIILVQAGFGIIVRSVRYTIDD